MEQLQKQFSYAEELFICENKKKNNNDKYTVSSQFFCCR